MISSHIHSCYVYVSVYLVLHKFLSQCYTTRGQYFKTRVTHAAISKISLYLPIFWGHVCSYLFHVQRLEMSWKTFQDAHNLKWLRTLQLNPFTRDLHWGAMLVCYSKCPVNENLLNGTVV